MDVYLFVLKLFTYFLQNEHNDQDFVTFEINDVFYFYATEEKLYLLSIHAWLSQGQYFVGFILTGLK